MKTIRYGDYLFFDKKVVGPVHKLVRRYGVKYNSYAGEVLRRIYHYFFGDAVNVNKEYEKYYKMEFENLDRYLECRLGIPENVRKRLLCNKLLCVDLSDKGERVGESFYYDDGLKKQFWEMVGGVENENPSGLRYEQFFD